MDGDFSPLAYRDRRAGWGSRFTGPPSGEPPRAVTACPAAMLMAALRSALHLYRQAVQAKTAWLLRFSPATCPHAEQRWLVNAGLIFSTRPRALCSSRLTRIPQPEARICRFSPALARTPRPGL